MRLPWPTIKESSSFRHWLREHSPIRDLLHVQHIAQMKIKGLVPNMNDPASVDERDPGAPGGREDGSEFRAA